MKFNLKKFSAKSKIKNTEMALEPQRDDSANGKGTYNALLNHVRENTDRESAIQGKLKKKHDNKSESRSLESLLKSHNPEDGMPKRTKNDSYDQIPVNLLEEISYQERAKAFDKNTTIRDKVEFWDKPITSSDAPEIGSQLHNHFSRFKNLTKKDVLNNVGVKKMIMASLQDADAMLYYIYKKCASEGRSLNKLENTLVNAISKEKVKMLRFIYG